MKKIEPNALYDVVQTLAQAMQEGRLDVRGDTARLSGQDAKLVGLINTMIDTLVSPMRLAAGALDEIAHGRIPPFVIDDHHGEYDRIKRSINTLLAVLYGMHNETMNLTNNVREGRLRTRGNDWDYEGIWKDLIAGVNKTLDAVVDPIQEASAVLKKLAAYDLNARMHGKYRGEHALIRDAMNKTADTLHHAIAQVASTVEQVSAVGQRVMQTNAVVADDAKEQSQRVSETTNSLDHIAANAKSSAAHTHAARENAQQASNAITTAKQSMEHMLAAMSDLHHAAEHTASIVSEIDSVANETGNLSNSASEKALRMSRSAGGFRVVAQEIRQLSARCSQSALRLKALEDKIKNNSQTQALEYLRDLIEDLTNVSIFANLLGINAAIEASHVMGAGTDFGNLTEEIRALAARSTDAARRTEQLITSSVEKTRNGVKLVNEVDTHLASAATGAVAISHLAQEIASATDDQAQGIDQINTSVAKINQITQRNAASAAHSLQAASELDRQMQQLSALVKHFKV